MFSWGALSFAMQCKDCDIYFKPLNSWDSRVVSVVSAVYCSKSGPTVLAQTTD